MEINDEMISKLANLSKLEFGKDEQEKVKMDLNDILAFVEKLEAVDTEGVEPLIYLNEDFNVMRPDESVHEITREDALKNAPQKDSDYFKVPTVLSKKS